MYCSAAKHCVRNNAGISRRSITVLSTLPGTASPGRRAPFEQLPLLPLQKEAQFFLAGCSILYSKSRRSSFTDLGAWLSAGLVAGPDEPKGLCQPKEFYDLLTKLFVRNELSCLQVPGRWGHSQCTPPGQTHQPGTTIIVALTSLPVPTKQGQQPRTPLRRAVTSGRWHHSPANLVPALSGDQMSSGDAGGSHR